MHYLITGGAGFIGSHLCEALVKAGHAVTVLDDLSTGKRDNLAKNIKLIEGDAADPKIVAKTIKGVDGIFHLAAIASVERSRTEWEATTKANLQASVTIFAAAARAKIPVVYASSAAIYGDCRELPITENARPLPQTAYGVDKYASELHAAVAQGVHQVPTIGLRFFNVYGPRQDPSSPYSGVIAIFADRLKHGQGITIFGDGIQSRDFIYIDDVVSHLSAAMKLLHSQGVSASEVFNVCTGRAVTLLELAATLGRLLSCTPAITHAEPRTGDIRASLGDPSRALALLHCRADTTLERGLASLLASGIK